MSPEKTTLEIIAPSVDEAVARGLVQLGIPRDAVDVEVLDGGSRGLLGIGGRQARVRLTIRVLPLAPQPEEPPAAPVPAPRPKVETTAAPTPTPESTHDLQLAKDVVHDLLERMKVNARVTAEYTQPEDDSDQPMILVDIQGDDLSILIGRRSETLNALQYITSLILCKELGRWVPLLIDVQGYRIRRERQLRQLARRMTDQAVHTGKRQVLEPMPASERRVIHLELRNHDLVTTESIGDEPNRKVTIVLKKTNS